MNRLIQNASAAVATSFFPHDPQYPMRSLVKNYALFTCAGAIGGRFFLGLGDTKGAIFAIAYIVSKSVLGAFLGKKYEPVSEGTSVVMGSYALACLTRRGFTHVQSNITHSAAICVFSKAAISLLDIVPDLGKYRF